MDLKRKILVVEDSHDSLSLLCNLLNEEGYVTFPADSGELALESLKNTIPDIILLDIRLPGISGIEVCKQIKQNPKLNEIPIIFITALTDTDDKLESFKAGAVDYVTKPFQKEELLARVKTQIDLFKLNRRYKILVDDLKKSNSDLLEAQHMAKIGSWKWDVKTDASTWSDELREIVHYDKDLPAPPFSEMAQFYTTESWQLLTDTVKDSHRTTKPFELELELICCDGVHKTTLVSGSVEYDEEGKVVYMNGTTQDITERVKGEKALQESEEKYKAIFEGTSDAIFVYDPETTIILDANNATSTMYQYSKDELIGMSCLKLSAEIKKSTKVNDEILKEGSAEVIFRYHKRKDGTIFTVDLLVFTINLNGKKVIFCVCKDTTKRKQAEDKMKNLIKLNDMILSTAGEGIYGLDLEGNTTFVNPEAAKLIGWDEEEIVGKNQHKLIHHTKADGTAYDGNECPIYASYRDGKVHHVDDELFWRKDGTSFPVEYTSTPMIDEQGELAGAVVTFSDITGRIEAEKELRRLLQAKEESVNEIQCIYSVSEIIRKQDTMKNVFQGIVNIIASSWNYPETTRVKAVYDGEVYVSEPFIESIWKQSCDILVNGEQRGSIAVYFLEERTEEEAGPFKKVEQSVINEITHKLSKELERRQMKKMRSELLQNQDKLVEQLIERNTALREFAYVAVHDLKAPLTNLESIMSMINNEVKGEEERSLIDMAKLALVRLKETVQLLNEAINLTRSDDQVNVKLSFENIFNEVKESLSEIILKENAKITPDFSACPHMMYSDIHLRSILQNLLTNAIKYRQADISPIVTVSTTLVQGRACLTIEDNGLGIDMELHKDKLFGLFKRFHDHVEGTGIGLYIIKSIVTSHGGNIKVKSKVNRGTTFKIILSDEKT